MLHFLYLVVLLQAYVSSYKKPHLPPQKKNDLKL